MESGCRQQFGFDRTEMFFERSAQFCQSGKLELPNSFSGYAD
jgi:hypothetical protein